MCLRFVPCCSPYVVTAAETVVALTAHRRWSVVHQLGGGSATALATSTTHKHMKLIPLGGVAAPLDAAHSLTVAGTEAAGVGADVPGVASTGAGASDATSLAVQGKAFCFLPLPVNTRLPVHVRDTQCWLWLALHFSSAPPFLHHRHSLLCARLLSDCCEGCCWTGECVL